MNKGDLVDLVSAELKTPKVNAQRAVEAVFHAIATGVGSDGKVAVSGFGTFRRKQRKPRVGRNPATREAIHIPASCTVAFTPSQSLKDRLDAEDRDGNHRAASTNGHANSQLNGHYNSNPHPQRANTNTNGHTNGHVHTHLGHLEPASPTRHHQEQHQTTW